MRLIDADKVIADNAEIIDCEIDHPKYQDTVREIIDSAETVDAVEVVRCKDCVYCENAHDKKGNTWIYCFKWEISPKQNWFCADGERKE